MKLYDQLAEWWPLMSAPSEYEEEAAFYERALVESCDGPCRGVLELGSGGGNNASHMKKRFTMVLADRSPGMLAVSRALNPECEHVEGDMRTLRLVPAVRRGLRPRRRRLHDDRAGSSAGDRDRVRALPSRRRRAVCARSPARDTSGRQPITAATMAPTAHSGTWSGPGIRIRPTTHTRSTTSMSCASVMVQRAWSSIGTSKACSLATSGCAGSATRASTRAWCRSTTRKLEPGTYQVFTGCRRR